MTIRVAIRHNTYYSFDRNVKLSPHIIRLRPAPHSRTPIQAYSLKIEPEEHFINWQQDAFGNFLARIVFPEACKKLSVEVECIVDMTVINPFDFFLEEDAEHVPFKYDKQSLKELTPYLALEATGEKFKATLKKVEQQRHPIKDENGETKAIRTIDFLVAANQCVKSLVDYTLRMEPGIQKPEETLEKGSGSCRDSAWLLVQLLRHCGIAARFASGYLVQLKPDVAALEGPSGPAEDFTDLHAWCEVFLPGAGWVGMDPTSGLFAGEGHIPLACAPDPVSAAPISGFTDKCEVELDFVNEVARIHEDPRVTKPYTDEEWQRILAVGDDVDKILETNDVRLTMGGEPTFVSIDDMESAQWNTEALGEHKLKLAKDLTLRLRDRFAANGMLHYGQGKWYPGEEIPRWALGIFWRKDGEALWQDDHYLAHFDTDYGFNHKNAEAFTQHLTERLGFDTQFCQPAYEDALVYLLSESALSVNDELNISKASSLERKRLAQVLDKGLDTPTGYLLPLAWNVSANRWASSIWSMRREKIVLIPGDSPMGLRLPLDSLPLFEESREGAKTAKPLRDEEIERDPFAPRTALPAYSEIPTHFDVSKAPTLVPQEDTKGDNDVLKTTLCVQARSGRLYVFMPPLNYLEHYVSLLACIEQTAKELSMPVVLEGYEPPKDSRIVKLLVTPDPGVIEVNVHPSNNWRELVTTTQALYEEAHQCRLGTEKFMLDGRHTGTGGGNHVTLGAATPADSPILRRPDLLRSMVTYWQHHPSLSYLFSGMFIGPTSQAPRVDEGRDEMLYELEVAFSQMDGDLPDQPWLVDRLFRNLLIDITGNTHRSEFCIDKLYSPGSASGRLGILELRGFEMPPHERMALVQSLLVRSLAARFWQEPYKKPLVRWGTLLHDRFMLPHYIWSDIQEVIDDLNTHGIAFDINWLASFEEFRFPHYGDITIDNINISLRWAIEPWHVLGEEIGSFGTARYVDSSVERIQIKVSGLTDSRYVLACNGHTVPLSTTGKHGEYVAGIRYRAWQPPSALHPNIGVHAPLVIDLIDTWNGRSVGGCTYHVAHEGGLSYDSFPVNAYEAESRRVNRFRSMNHSQGPYAANKNAASNNNIVKPQIEAKRSVVPHGSRPINITSPLASNEYPHTLDLRRV